MNGKQNASNQAFHYGPFQAYILHLRLSAGFTMGLHFSILNDVHLSRFKTANFVINDKVAALYHQKTVS